MKDINAVISRFVPWCKFVLLLKWFVSQAIENYLSQSLDHHKYSMRFLGPIVLSDFSLFKVHLIISKEEFVFACSLSNKNSIILIGEYITNDFLILFKCRHFFFFGENRMIIFLLPSLNWDDIVGLSQKNFNMFSF